MTLQKPAVLVNAAVLLLAPIVLVILLTGLKFGLVNTALVSLSGITTNLIEMAVVSPLIVLAAVKSRVQWKRLLLPAMIYIGFGICEIVPFDWKDTLGLTFNWFGQGAGFIWLLIVIAVVPGFTSQRFGLGRPTESGWFGPIVIVTVMMGILSILGGSGGELPTLEYTAYEALMPGLAEELAFRGVLLVLLNDLFGRPWTILGAKMGWGSLITSVLFAMVHVVYVDPQFQIHWNWSGAITFIAGLMLVYIRERSGVSGLQWSATTLLT
jgi:Type II CAAX prenyl endopeptidase Rce1-like